MYCGSTVVSNHSQRVGSIARVSAAMKRRVVARYSGCRIEGTAPPKPYSSSCTASPSASRAAASGWRFQKPAGICPPPTP